MNTHKHEHTLANSSVFILFACKSASKVYFSIYFFFFGGWTQTSTEHKRRRKTAGFIFIPSEMQVPSAAFRKPPLCCWGFSQLRTVSDFKSHHSHAPSLFGEYAPGLSTAGNQNNSNKTQMDLKSSKRTTPAQYSEILLWAHLGSECSSVLSA